MKAVILILLVGLTVSQIDQVYSEEDAYRYLIASSYSYCDAIPVDECGQASQLIKNSTLEINSYMLTGEGKDSVNCVIFEDHKNKEVVVAFSGTKNPKQLIGEIIENFPRKYTKHEIPGAKVLGFFWDHYDWFDDFTDFRLRNIFEKNKKKFKDYTLVFTGHSLGGALAVHAAVDIYHQYLVDGSKMKVYTYGQPRVGNKEFEDWVSHHIESNFRIIHNRDLVAHVPPCVPKITSISSCADHGILPYYPYHTMTEIYYKSDMNGAFMTCTNHEDKHCSNSHIDLSIGDHTVYFGINVGNIWTYDVGEDWQNPFFLNE